MRKIDIVIKKFKKDGKDFLGSAYIHSNKCPKDYGIKNLLNLYLEINYSHSTGKQQHFEDWVGRKITAQLITSLIMIWKS